MGEIRKLNQDYFEATNDLSEFAFQYRLTEEEKDRKRVEKQRHSIWAWLEDDGELAAKVHIIPMQIHLQHQIVKMGGISSVATWPEYRRGGKVKKLLQKALYEMKERGQIVSFLHPFSIPFYRKFGWEVTFSHDEIDISIDKLKKEWDAVGYVKRKKNNDETIDLLGDIYTRYASEFAGPLDRDKNWWKERLLDKKEIIAVAYNQQHEVEGYILYDVKDNILRIKDIAFLSLNGKRILYNFISNHDSMATNATMRLPENNSLRFLVDNPKFEQKNVSYFMSRIVDVETFLQSYAYKKPYQLKPFALEIEDSFMEDNSGFYLMKQEGSNVKVTRVTKLEEGTPTLTISVQQLAVLFFGYQRPNELLQLQLINGDTEALLGLTSIIAEQQPYFPDFF